LQVWDVIPLDEFKTGKSAKTYEHRFADISAAVDSFKPKGADATADKLANKYGKFWIIPTKVVNNLTEAVTHFEELLASGEEGTILKNYCGLWEDTRSKHLVKFKSEKDADLIITGFNPGKGQFEGMVGSVVCESSDGLVQVNISGFDVKTRQYITDNQASLLGTIMTVMYNERIKSSEKGRENVDSLFLPRFTEFRLDKTVANSSKEIT
jgi:DNA ligase-1